MKHSNKPRIILPFFDKAGRRFMKLGKNGKAFVNKLNLFSGKMVKVHRKAHSRPQGVIQSNKRVPLSIRRVLRNK